MATRLKVAWTSLAIGEYVEDKAGGIWKVTHSVTREDGRWLGLTNAEGKQRKISPAVAVGEVTQVIYREVTPEEAEQAAIKALGGQVIARETGQGWLHEPLVTLHASRRLLLAHLVRFHPGSLEGLNVGHLERDDLSDIHVDQHGDNPDTHTHLEV